MRGKALDFLRLDQLGRLEELVHRADAARHDDEGVGVLDEHDLAHVEVAEGHPAVQIRVDLLFLGENDVASDGKTAGLFRAAVGRLHDAGSSAGHDSEADLRQLPSHRSRERVVGMIFLEPRRPEDGHARTHEVERAEAADEFRHDRQERLELAAARARSFQEEALLRLGLGRLDVLALPRWSRAHGAFDVLCSTFYVFV